MTKYSNVQDFTAQHKKLYRVDLLHQEGKTFDSSTFTEVSHPESYSNFESWYTLLHEICEQSHCVAMQAQESMFRFMDYVLQDPVQHLRNRKEDYRDGDIVLTREQQIRICVSFIAIQEKYTDSALSLSENLLNIGPYLYDIIRQGLNSRGYSLNIGRHECAYFFTNIDDCQYYLDTHLPDTDCHKIYEVETLEPLTEENTFIGDMRWQEQMTLENLDTKAIEAAAQHFWLHHFTDTPMYEIMYRGKYTLKI